MAVCILITAAGGWVDIPVKTICVDITASSTTSDFSRVKITHPEDTEQTGTQEAG